MAQDVAIFSAAEQESLGRDWRVRPYRSISKEHLFGLLAALGDYAIRTRAAEGPVHIGHAPSAEAKRAHQQLARPWCGGFEYLDRREPPPSDAVFTANENKFLLSNKYLKYFVHLSKPDLVSLLQALGEFSCHVEPVPFDKPLAEARAAHAQNALIAFRDRPFTTTEFGRSIGTHVEGYCSNQLDPPIF
jgi:hypothetical protein